MTLLDIYNLLKTEPNLMIFIGIVCCTLIEISPLKLNPFGWILNLFKGIFSWMCEQLTHQVSESLKDTIKEEIQEVHRKIDVNRINDIRWQILSFAKSLPNNDNDIESFDSVYDMHDEYEDLLEAYDLTNGKISRAMKKIDIYYDNLIKEERE